VHPGGGTSTVIYYQKNGDTFISLDTADADNAPNMLIRLSGPCALTADDFILA
jgi:hypothetical protein